MAAFAIGAMATADSAAPGQKAAGAGDRRGLHGRGSPARRASSARKSVAQGARRRTRWAEWPADCPRRTGVWSAMLALSFLKPELITQSSSTMRRTKRAGDDRPANAVVQMPRNARGRRESGDCGEQGSRCVLSRPWRRSPEGGVSIHVLVSKLGRPVACRDSRYGRKPRPAFRLHSMARMALVLSSAGSPWRRNRRLAEDLAVDLGLELAVSPLGDLDEVEVLDREAVVAELEGAAQRREVGRLQRGLQGLLVGDLPARLLHGGVDHHGGVIGVHGVARRDVAVLLLEGRDERLVLRRVEVRRPVAAAEQADGGVLLGGEGGLVHGEGGEEDHLVGQAGLAELLDQVHAHAARHEGEDRVRLLRRELGEFGREVELAERNIDLVDDLALEVALEAGDRVLAGLIVRHEQNDALEIAVLRHLAENLVVLVVLVGGDDEIRAAGLSGEGGWAGVGRDEEGLGLRHRPVDRGQHVGEDRPDDELRRCRARPWPSPWSPPRQASARRPPPGFRSAGRPSCRRAA